MDQFIWEGLKMLKNYILFVLAAYQQNVSGSFHWTAVEKEEPTRKITCPEEILVCNIVPFCT